MKRLLIVANRLPVKVQEVNGDFKFQPSAGGLATGLNSLNIEYEKHWIGWPGIYPKDESKKEQISAKLERDLIHPVFLSPRDINLYYEGFSNKTVWPLFHYFSEYTIYKNDFWKAYEEVNLKFCERVIEIANPEDIIWIQDYHLMLLPDLLRKKLPKAQIGFFLHIPFPSYELFRTLPWRKKLLSGLLGSDLIGFHTYEYMRHFMSALYRILGMEPTLGRLYYENRTIQIDAFPMGIDYNKFHNAGKAKTVKKHVAAYSKRLKNEKLILSVDRLDYSKGILQRLKAYDRFLSKYPKYKNKISMLLLVVPSRSSVSDYKSLKEEIDEEVGRINGKFSKLEWAPIYYLYRSLSFQRLSALYNMSDIALVTPFRDGMNLVAKEFVASKVNSKGVLILSEMAGSALELKDAVCVNPNDIDNIVASLATALEMPEEEQKERMNAMQAILSKQTVQKWANDFITALDKTHFVKLREGKKSVSKLVKHMLKKEYDQSENRLLLLDYDGTLLPFTNDPRIASPDDELVALLQSMTEEKGTKIVVMSNRDQETLEHWFEDINVDLIAEYGSWYREDGQWTQKVTISKGWKNEIMEYLHEFVEKTPGSFIEEKSYSLVWHYRRTDSWLADLRVQEFINTLHYPCSRLNLEILEGNKAMEIKVGGIDKDKTIYNWVKMKDWDFILAMGDDHSDEEMFKTLPSKAFTLKASMGPSHAKYMMQDPHEARALLFDLSAKARRNKNKGKSRPNKSDKFYLN